jgi:hypothetical protein
MQARNERIRLHACLAAQRDDFPLRQITNLPEQRVALIDDTDAALGN